MEISVDLTKVPRIEPVPSGVYIFKAVGSKTGKSQAGNDKITYECDVVAPREIAEAIPKFYMHMSLTENAMFRMTDLFEACDSLHAGNFNTDEILGKEFGAIVTFEMNDVMNRPANNVVRYLRAADTKAAVSEENIKKAEELKKQVPQNVSEGGSSSGAAESIF